MTTKPDYSEARQQYLGTYLPKPLHHKFSLIAIRMGLSRCGLLRKLALDLIDRDTKQKDRKSKSAA